METLKVNHLTQRFGGVVAIEDVSCEVKMGEKVGIIGPNGAGKTTLFNCLTGIYVPTEGSISLNGETTTELTGMSVEKITELGLARTFQNIRLFKDLTLLDNLKVAMNFNVNYSKFDAVFRTRNFYREERIMQEKADSYLDIVDLKDKAEQKASSLSYGEQRRLEIVRALATGAKYLFLDEPAAGMNPQETNDLRDFINLIHSKFELTIVLIEHDMGFVMDLCDRIYVLNYGKCIAEGTPKEIQSNKLVIDAYLGNEDA
ncbi:ABC transporter ATP-binding protein [Erysipelothrix larvae]|uniref:ABC transporter ATP-binding protein n=1 Tax=Erysipelothrix larvae TaxID=1514105 RepID=A0A0X8H031_9FIRM|nr:ABC transporter ATP-binding protein [Erysipelothrix larvae]AMC93404.1 ABC transporter ATP-binding protein [Erysipelothrix larvae]